MPENWFNRNYGRTEQPSAQSLWLFSVEAAVRVPKTGMEEEESQTAHKVLQTVLNQTEGDASLHTAVDSNIQFQIQFAPTKG